MAITATAGGTLSLSFTDTQATVGDWIALAASGVDDPLRLWVLDVSWGTPDPAFQPGHKRHPDLHDALHAGPVEFRLFANDTSNPVATSTR